MSRSFKLSVWAEPTDADLALYVQRCSCCGRVKPRRELRVHWFFTGMYCITCVLVVLYDDARSEKEIARRFEMPSDSYNAIYGEKNDS